MHELHYGECTVFDGGTLAVEYGRNLETSRRMKVVFADRARQDIADIYDTVSAHDMAAALRVEAMMS